AKVRPAGPQPMISTSTSWGRLSGLNDAAHPSDGSEISGLPGLNPLRWNCIGHVLPSLAQSLHLAEQRSCQAPAGALAWRPPADGGFQAIPALTTFGFHTPPPTPSDRRRVGVCAHEASPVQVLQA